MNTDRAAARKGAVEWQVVNDDHTGSCRTFRSEDEAVAYAEQAATPVLIRLMKYVTDHRGSYWDAIETRRMT